MALLWYIVQKTWYCCSTRPKHGIIVVYATKHDNNMALFARMSTVKVYCSCIPLYTSTHFVMLLFI